MKNQGWQYNGLYPVTVVSTGGGSAEDVQCRQIQSINNSWYALLLQVYI